MSKEGEIEEASGERRYSLLLAEDELGLEQLTLSRLVALAESHRDEIPTGKLIALARRLYESRRARSKFFNNSLLGEPVWDMLLALYCLPRTGENLSVTGLSYAAGVPQTTGLRWSQVMEQKGFIERKHDENDRRRVYLFLTAEGERLMRDYLSSIYHKLTSA